nr:SCP2 sterol-binding domain-containing protein [uncultured Aquimarina sp.]
MSKIENVLETIQEKAGKADSLKNTLKFNFGEDQLFIDGTGDKNLVSIEDKEADCQVDVTFDDFMALIKGELNPMGAVMNGKVKIKGDMGVAMKLQSLFA